ncbi:MAG TPA: hypothetical protein VFE32_02345 [Puia sp.]|jgi:hypothetical protein|nr:hypothetical protein [Puia sp.]
MFRYLFLTAVAILMSFTVACAQDTSPQKTPSQSSPPFRSSDIFTLGIGFGQDYGGIGGNLTVYPQENIGLFIGAGYALAGFGYNAGLKLRLLPDHGRSKVRPFVEGMYGYNAAIVVTNYSQDNKMFYGPTIGAGLDLGSTEPGKGYLSLAILVPFRSPDVQNYIDQLNANGVTFKNNLIPISFSIGYKFVLN